MFCLSYTEMWKIIIIPIVVMILGTVAIAAWTYFVCKKMKKRHADYELIEVIVERPRHHIKKTERQEWKAAKERRARAKNNIRHRRREKKINIRIKSEDRLRRMLALWCICHR
ncbi:hypothetical protein GDO78_015580, partial [Eleutherodactylus coqui]